MQIGDLAKISTSSLASSSSLKWDSNTRHPGGSPMNKPPDHPQPPPPTTNTLAPLSPPAGTVPHLHTRVISHPGKPNRHPHTLTSGDPGLG